jgi:thimet oligopeptidase
MKSLQVAVVAVVASMVVWANTSGVRTAEAVDQSPFAAGLTSPEAVTSKLSAHIDAAEQKLAALTSMGGPHTVDNTLRLYDDIEFDIAHAEDPASVMRNTNPDLAVRQAAEAIISRARTVKDKLHESPGAYAAVAAIDLTQADAEAQYYVKRLLSAFRHEGADRDEATRAKLHLLRAQLADAMAAYQRNLRVSPTMTVSGRDELAGLPDDFIARHPPDASGAITLRPNDADRGPVMVYAKRADVRRRMFLGAATIAYPENNAVLKQIIELRYAIARLLGWESFAAYEAALRMVGTPETTRAFIDRVLREAKPRVDLEYADLLKAKREDEPTATRIEPWDYEFYRERVRTVAYGFDSQAARPYLAYDRVRDGVIAVASQMYGLTFRARTDIPVWHPSVEVYEVLDRGKLIGRFYLDMHPRAGKAGAGGLTSAGARGAEGKQLPEIVIQGSLPGGQPGDSGLLTFALVRDVMFHEFAHGIAWVIGGHNRFFGLGPIGEEPDFLEVSSRLFETWPSDAHVLSTFARHYQTNAPIPAALIAQLVRANDFGKALTATGDIAFSRFDQVLNGGNPKDLDVEAVMRDVMTADAPWLYAPGVHRESGMGQLANYNYAASYYAYSWGQAISKDLLTKFKAGDLLAPGPAHAYRDSILNPAASIPAAVRLQHFLERPWDQHAYSVWINQDPS